MKSHKTAGRNRKAQADDGDEPDSAQRRAAASRRVDAGMTKAATTPATARSPASPRLGQNAQQQVVSVQLTRRKRPPVKSWRQELEHARSEAEPWVVAHAAIAPAQIGPSEREHRQKRSLDALVSSS